RDPGAGDRRGASTDPDRARRGARAARAARAPRRGRKRSLGPGHPRSPHRPEHAQHAARAGDGDDPDRDHRRSDPLLPRARRPATHAVLGRDARRRAVVLDRGAALGRLPGPRDLPLLAVLQPARRRAARRPRPEDATVTAPLLEVRELSVRFETDEGTIHAVDRVSFSLDAGEVLGLVGESGCGKSVTTMAMLRLLPPTAIVSGEALFAGVDLLRASPARLRRIRGRR